MNKGIRQFCVGGLLSALGISCGAEQLICPPSTRIASATLTGVPEHWVVVPSDGKLKLFGVRFYSGPPSQRAELKPEPVASREKGVIQSRWDFGADASSKDGVWMRCDYGQQAVSMATRVPDNVTQCVDRYRKTKGGFAFEGISCKTE